MRRGRGCFCVSEIFFEMFLLFTLKISIAMKYCPKTYSPKIQIAFQYFPGLHTS